MYLMRSESAVYIIYIVLGIAVYFFIGFYLLTTEVFADMTVMKGLDILTEFCTKYCLAAVLGAITATAVSYFLSVRLLKRREA